MKCEIFLRTYLKNQRISKNQIIPKISKTALPNSCELMGPFLQIWDDMILSSTIKKTDFNKQTLKNDKYLL